MFQTSPSEDLLVPTAILIVAILSAVIGMLLAWAACLRAGLRFVSVRDVSWKKLLVLSAALYAVNFLLAIGADRLSQSLVLERLALAVGVAQLALYIALNCTVIAICFRLPPWRAIVAWMPTLAVPIGSMLFLIFVWRPYLVEAHVASTNSMGPTLLGPHVEVTCEKCGGLAYGVPRGPLASDTPPERMGTICQEHFHNATAPYLAGPIFSADRFITSKWLSPRRWDLITFHVPFAPDELYVKRLVGLPGETIFIKDGAVWANGVRLDPPAEIAELRYSTELEGLPMKLWGTEDKPAMLDEDEYFVLGDFTSASADSRMWLSGAPGHPPYAVPASNIMGVVTHIYWPPSRCRIFEQHADLPLP